MFALASLLIFSPLVTSQSPDLVELLIREYQQVPGLPGSSILEFRPPVAGRGGGWAAEVLANDGMGNPVARMIIGQRPGGVDGPVELLRQPSLIQGAQQGRLRFPSMAGSTVAYLDFPIGSGGTQRVWVEDQLIAQSGQPVPGSNGWTWTDFLQVELTASGSAFVLGYADNGAGDWRQLAWRWPAGQVLVATGDQLAGFSHRVERLSSNMEVSPDGSHWSVKVKERVTNRDALVVDGAILDVGGGRLAIEGELLPSPLTGGGAAAHWQTLFEAPVLNNVGDYAFQASLQEVGGSYQYLRVRNGRRFSAGEPQSGLVGIDARGAVLAKGYQGQTFLTLEGYPVIASLVAVDVDGDGQADSDPELLDTQVYNVVAPDDQGLSLFVGAMEGPFATARQGVFRGRSLRTDDAACEGVPNSTGRPGQLVAVGSGGVLDNEVSLRLFGLPADSTGYVLLSQTAGFVPQAGGSQGNLCLAGPIGRMLQDVFTAPAVGRADVTLDLAALPQPTGAVAAMAGETWHAQAWYRDSIQGMATSNFTSASALTFQ